GAGTPVLALDARRLPAVAAWPAGTTPESVAAVSRALSPRRASGVSLVNGSLAVSADVSASGAASRGLSHLVLGAWLFDPVDGTFTVDLGRLRAGGSAYRGAAQKNCPCRLVGVGVLPSSSRVPSSGEVHLAVSALAYESRAGAPRRSRAGLTSAEWRSGVAGV